MELRQISLSQITTLCREETDKFLRREPSRDAYCLELFRRAVEERDAGAWAAVFAQYRGLVFAWLGRAAGGRPGDDAEQLASRTFERFWSAVGPERFVAFPSMAAILRYLKMCAHSVVLDEARARQGVRTESLTNLASTPDAAPDMAEALVEQDGAWALWRAILAETRDEVEERVAYLCFVLDMKPREVQEREPGLFASVDDVYRVKRNLVERLRRSERLRDWLR